MSITGSFYTGLSGLNTHGTAMQVIGDNVANMHTTGFKNSAVHFEDVLGASLSGVTGGSQTGAGSEVETVDANFVQGSLETTDVATDVSVNGKGFFIVGDPVSDELFYTRAGHFTIDNEGYYVNSQGYRVQGFLYDSNENLIESLASIEINQNSMVAPQVTSLVEMGLNLDASATPPTYSGTEWDDLTAYALNAYVYSNPKNGYSYKATVAGISGAAQPTWPTTIGATVVDGTVTWTTMEGPSDISNFSTMVTIYDTLGQSHPIQVYFRKTSANNWAWHSIIDAGELSGGTAGVYQQVGTGAMVFNTSGVLTSPAAATDFNTAAITFANGSSIAANAMDIDFTGTTQYGSDSAIQELLQDGYAAGTVSGVAIDEDGNIVANYTNGTRKELARLALADFPNLNGLTRKGATLFKSTTTSGDALYNKPGVGGMGVISSSMLEESNVDLAGEIIKMIVIQRGYQANSKIIATTDELLNTLINIR